MELSCLCAPHVRLLQFTYEENLNMFQSNLSKPTICKKKKRMLDVFKWLEDRDEKNIESISGEQMESLRRLVLFVHTGLQKANTFYNRRNNHIYCNAKQSQCNIFGALGSLAESWRHEIKLSSLSDSKAYMFKVCLDEPDKTKACVYAVACICWVEATKI